MRTGTLASARSRAAAGAIENWASMIALQPASAAAAFATSASCSSRRPASSQHADRAADNDGFGEHRLVGLQHRYADGPRDALDGRAERRAGEQDGIGAQRYRVAAERIEAAEDAVGQFGGERAVAAQRIVEQVDEVGLGPGLGESCLDGIDGGGCRIDESDACHVFRRRRC